MKSGAFRPLCYNRKKSFRRPARERKPDREIS